MSDRRRYDHDELPVHPLHSEPVDPPPPLREQLPLPRRRGQEHLAPQLRMPGDTDTGTPFAAFTPSIPGQRTAPDRDTAAQFQDGSRQARSRTRGRRRAAND
jgi:hypothetical protein